MGLSDKWAKLLILVGAVLLVASWAGIWWWTSRERQEIVSEPLADCSTGEACQFSGTAEDLVRLAQGDTSGVLGVVLQDMEATELPPEIARFSNLVFLHIAFSPNITRLPPDIVQLGTLRRLVVGKGQLTPAQLELLAEKVPHVLVDEFQPL